MLRMMTWGLVSLLLMMDAGRGAEHEGDDERMDDRSGPESEGVTGDGGQAPPDREGTTTGPEGLPGSTDGEVQEEKSAAEARADDRSGELTELKARLERRDAALAKANGRLSEAHAELETLRAFVVGQIAAAREDLPAPLLAFDPGEESGLAARLAWLETAREQAGKVRGEPQPGNGADPRPGGPAERKIPSPVPLRNMF